MMVDDSLRALAGMAGSAVVSVQPMSTESRNSLWRVTLDGPVSRAILKAYDPATDPHAANRFRREEKVLTLLATAQEPVAPRVLAGMIAPSAPSLLLMEDAGNMTLADALMEMGPGVWTEAVAFAKRLHGEMARIRHPLFRTAMAISLDRISTPVLVTRFRIAAQRLVNRETPYGIRREYRDLMTPMRTAHKAMIHNSLSPLNIVLGDSGWRAVDWETLTLASPVWDWAELLRSPFCPLSYAESLDIAVEATGDEAGLFHRAVLSRCLDSLATVTLRGRRCHDENNPERAMEYARRSACYRADIREAMGQLEVSSDLGRWLEALTGDTP